MTDTTKFGALASILVRDLNEIADLPSYKTPLPGVYTFTIDKIAPKDVQGKTTINVEYSIVDIIELANPSILTDPELMEEYKDQIVKPGDKFSETFWFDKPEFIEQTLSVLKAKFGGLADACGTTNLMEIMEKAEGMKVSGVVGNRVDKSDRTKIYPSTKNIVPAI